MIKNKPARDSVIFRGFVACLGTVFALAAVSCRAEVPLAPATIVVFNSDNSESAELAKFYAGKRSIPRDHLVGLRCSQAEEISREEFDSTIATPLRAAFTDRKWWSVRAGADQQPTATQNTIRFVALMKGIPLKIKATSDYPGDQVGPAPIGNRNEASVDSEIAVLGAYAHQISGFVANPYFQSFRPITELENSPVMLVCRLDAPTVSTVKRMITDALEAEKNGLWGRAYVDGAHNTAGGFQLGDRWLAAIPTELRKVGVPVVYDDAPAIFPEGYPITNCALYYGWYSGSVGGAFTEPTFRFVPGAVAVHIHSFSAATLRDPAANWAAPLVTKGAAATLGNVYEPYLQLTAHLDILNDRLLHGFTLAESSYMAMQGLSWMNVVIGDPLYRPYAAWLDLKRDAAKSDSDWKTYHDFATKNGSRPAPDFRTAARQLATRLRNGAMIEDLGSIEAREGNLAAATNYYAQARTLYTQRDDLLRVVLEEADAWIKLHKPARALALVRSVSRIVSDAPAAPLLRKIETDLSGPASGAPKP
ncbi:MAG: TIGR03790 family protein [Verrucomicrobiota bacterium]|nr:TIGR03790 family protein [Verrucomicrobiota bacterium]